MVLKIGGKTLLIINYMDKMDKIENLKKLQQSKIDQFNLQKFFDPATFDSKAEDKVLTDLFNFLKSQLSFNLAAVEALFHASLTLSESEITKDVFDLVSSFIEQSDEFIGSFKSFDVQEGGMQDA